MSSPLTSSNRVNIPAVCRLRDAQCGATVGSGILIGPGLLLTSTVALPSAEAAADIVATFFEGTKKRAVDVALQPTRYYFAARYPAGMDYCLVGCDAALLVNVTAAYVGLTEKAWAPISEGDVLLIVEHSIGGDGDGNPPSPSASDASGAAAPSEQKYFEEVLRCRGHLGYFAASGNRCTTGCPAFNENGQLVGLQSQSRVDGEGVVNRVLFLTSIVKHLFANGQLPNLPQTGLTFEEVWSTWYLTNDISRVVAILANFTGKAMAQQVTCRLCELTASPALTDSVAENGGIEVILQNLALLGTDKTLAEVGLRALWNLSIGKEANLVKICEHDGVVIILGLVEAFPDNETVLQLSAVLLHNVNGCAAAPDFRGPLGDRVMTAHFPGFQQHRECVALQKFALSLFATLVRMDSRFAVYLMEHGIVDHLVHLIGEKPKQIFLMEMVVGLLAELAQFPETVEATKTEAMALSSMQTSYLVDLLIHLILEYRESDALMVSGNRALWGLGNIPACRAMILENPRGMEALRVSLPALVASTHRQSR